MPSKNPEQRLLDIVDNATAIASYIERLDVKTFCTERMRRDAVERCLQRISEAAVKLGNDAKKGNVSVRIAAQTRRSDSCWPDKQA